MSKPLYTIILSSILLGIIALGLNTLFGANTVSYIVQERVNDIIISKYDIWGYISNLNNSIFNTTRLELSIQTRTWQDPGANVIDGWFWSALGNDLAYMTNWGIFALNIMIYPIRIGAYVLGAMFAVLGLNTTTQEYNSLYWLVDVVHFLEELQIPYV